MARKVRDVMTGGAECVKDSDTVVDAARRLTELNIGALPICGPDGRLEGILTDRDIMVNVVAAGRDPAAMTVADIADRLTVTISADDSVDAALDRMAEHKIRRLPVVNGDHLIGVLSRADLVQALDDDAKTAQLVEAIFLEP